MKERNLLKNYFNIKGYKKFSLYFRDFAIIRVKKMPKYYEPIKFYQGKLYVKHKVQYVGYGRNSIFDDQNDYNTLRWSDAEVVGFYTKPNEFIMGLQTYSPAKQQSCFGDSGGPLITKVDGIPKLLGIASFTSNDCGNETWYLMPQYYINQLQEDIKNIRSWKNI